MHWFLLESSRNLDVNLLLFAYSKQNNIRSLLIFLLRMEKETKQVTSALEFLSSNCLPVLEP